MKKAIWKKTMDQGSRKEYSLQINGTEVGKVYRRADFVKRNETDRIRTKQVNLYDIIWDRAGLELVMLVETSCSRDSENMDDVVTFRSVYNLRSEEDTRAVVKEMIEAGYAQADRILAGPEAATEQEADYDGDKLNENEAKVLKAVHASAMDETGGEFTFGDQVAGFCPEFTKQQVAGYMGQLATKGMIYVHELGNANGYDVAGTQIELSEAGLSIVKAATETTEATEGTTEADQDMGLDKYKAAEVRDEMENAIRHLRAAMEAMDKVREGIKDGKLAGMEGEQSMDSEMEHIKGEMDKLDSELISHVSQLEDEAGDWTSEFGRN